MNASSSPEKKKPARIIIYLGLAVLTAIVFVGRYYVGLKPSQEQIELDCGQLVDGTTVWAGRGLLPIQRVEHPFRQTYGTRILGISTSGNEAIVEVDVPLQGRIAFQVLPEGGGAGFGKYFTKAVQVSPFEDVRIKAKLVYRKYDSGWKLESY